MRTFVAKHAAVTAGTLSCSDRLLLEGRLVRGYEQAMVTSCRSGQCLRKAVVLQEADGLKTHPWQTAAADRAGTWHFRSRKDRRARAIATRCSTRRQREVLLRSGPQASKPLVYAFYRNGLTADVYDDVGASRTEAFLFHNVRPKLQIHALAVNEKVPGVQFCRYAVTQEELDLLAHVQRTLQNAKRRRHRCGRPNGVKARKRGKS